MHSDIINVKECTNYIPVLKLAQVLLLIVLVSSPLCLDASEKTWVIVIDPGHGGRDPGALGSSSREKDINLAIALKTGEYLERYVNNVKVLYTRKTDVFIGLKERAEFANKNKADLFISIHANAMSASKGTRGTETYIMGPSKDDQNLEVAMKENEVIMYEDNYSVKYEGFDPKSPESYIIFSLMQNVFQEQSTNFASKIQNQFRTRAGRIDRGVKQDVFWVLYMTSMPSVLIETGFITNSEEEKYLLSTQGQEYIASAIYRAARDYINEIDKKSQISTFAGTSPQTVQDSSVSDVITSDNTLKFMVQVKSSVERIDLKPENFKSLKEIYEIPSNDHFKYATGNFSNYSEAVEYRRKIESIYPDAFVIAVKDNKILPLQEAFNYLQNK